MRRPKGDQQSRTSAAKEQRRSEFAPRFSKHGGALPRRIRRRLESRDRHQRADLQISYDVSPRIKLTILGASLFHACFGGTAEPWTAANPPSNVTCGYGPAGGAFNSTLYPANFYNGTSVNDFAANKARTPFTQSYSPANLNNGAIGAGVPPVNVYFNAQVKI